MTMVVDLKDVLGDGQGEVLEVEFDGLLWFLVRREERAITWGEVKGERKRVERMPHWRKREKEKKKTDFCDVLPREEEEKKRDSQWEIKEKKKDDIDDSHIDANARLQRPLTRGERRGRITMWDKTKRRWEREKQWWPHRCIW